MTLDYFYGQSGELFAYFRIPKALFQDSRFRQLSTDARTLYGILLDRMSLSAKNGWLDEQGRVYIIYTVREVQESLCCAEHKAVKLFRELEQANLIERKRRGLGRPSLIYVKNFSSGLPKAQVQNCANSNSCAAENAVQVQPKPQSNKTDKNNTELSNTDSSIHPGAQPEEVIEEYRKEIRENIEYDHLRRQHPYDDIDEIADLMLEVLCTQGSFMRIGGKQLYTALVKERFLKLDSSHIEYVLDCLRESTADIRNIKAYLLEMLFNAPATCGSYYRAKVNHDFHDSG